jgi:hypothetical protein
MLRSRTTGTAASTSRTTRSIVPESAAVGRVVRITTFILGGETPCWSRQAAFSFGYGLSYSTFRYSELKVERSAGGVLRTSARITNDSELNGDEVAQLYITSPLPELKGFQRVHIRAGESRFVEFDVPVGQTQNLTISVGQCRRRPTVAGHGVRASYGSGLLPGTASPRPALTRSDRAIIEEYQ